MQTTIFSFLAGTWFIAQTSLPMWLKGDKMGPTLNYTITECKGETVLLDEVKYSKKGKQKTITGYDKINPANPNAFTWRGKGLLSLSTSDWEIRLKDPQGQWAVSWFSKTLFTPEGVDILSRTPTLSAATMDSIKQAMKADTLLVRFVDKVQALPQP